MNGKQLLKKGLQVIIECDANPTTIVIRLSKKQLLEFINWILPDNKPDKG